MSKHHSPKGIISENFLGIGPVTLERVHARARELAVINGHAAHEISQSDWDQANQELTGKLGMDKKEAFLESVPESERWNPLPGSPGHQAPEIPSEERDDEGRSQSEQLFEAGINEAEHEQMLQAMRIADEADRRES